MGWIVPLSGLRVNHLGSCKRQTLPGESECSQPGRVLFLIWEEEWVGILSQREFSAPVPSSLFRRFLLASKSSYVFNFTVLKKSEFQVLLVPPTISFLSWACFLFDTKIAILTLVREYLECSEHSGMERAKICIKVSAMRYYREKAFFFFFC